MVCNASKSEILVWWLCDYACEVLWDQHVSDFHFTLRSWQRVVDHFATGWHSTRISSTHGQPYLCLYRQQKLWSVLNYPFGFILWWDYDCFISARITSLEFGDYWISEYCFISSTTICFCQPSLLAPIFHGCCLVPSVATVWPVHQYLPQLLLVKLITIQST